MPGRSSLGYQKIPPLVALFAILILGITVEIVEERNKEAAYALVVLLILGMITFNAQIFQGQIQGIITVLGAAPSSGGNKSSGRVGGPVGPPK